MRSVTILLSGPLLRELMAQGDDPERPPVNNGNRRLIEDALATAEAALRHEAVDDRRRHERDVELAREAPTDDLEEQLYRVISARQDRQDLAGYPAYSKREAAKAVADYLHHNRCLAKLDPGEEIFVVKARDILAHQVVTLWANLFAIVMGEDHPKAVDARTIAARMKGYKGARFPS